MDISKPTPEEKRQRRIDIVKEYEKRCNKKGVVKSELRIELAEKYRYKNERVVEQIIIKARRKKEQNAKKK